MRRPLLSFLCVLGCSTALAQTPTLLVEYRSVSAMTATTTTIRVTLDGAITSVTEGPHSPAARAQATLSPADLARVRTAVQSARIAPQPQRHAGPMLPDPVSESMTLPRRAHVAWTSGDTPAPETLALRDLLVQLAPDAPHPAVSSGPPGGGADS